MSNIYISSTFTDLEDFRRQVSVTVRRMHHLDVAMEYYGAEDTRPLDRCLADVATCDLYICIVAWRYGFTPPGRSQSITELEYRQAVESGKPCLAFLLSETAPWPHNRIEMNAYERVQAFREELRNNWMVAEFTDSADLARAVGEAIYNWEHSRGGTPDEGRADWESYRRAVFDTHRWVRLAVIAGAKQDRRFTEIPLTEVFVTQPVQAGPPEYDIPEAPSWADPGFDPVIAADEGRPEEEAGLPLETSAELGGAITESSLDVLGRERRQVFLGAPGTGKSTLLLDATLLLCDTGRDPASLPVALRGAPIPFLVELRQYVLDKAASFVDYMAASATRQYGVEIDAESIEAVLAAEGRALVVFDGLDEVFDPRAQSQVIDEFRAFARAHPETRLIVTSRIAGYRALELERDGFRHYTLLGFGVPEIREFIPKWYTYYTWQGDTRDARGLMRRISESPRLLELAHNPLLLTMMAVIYKHQDLPEKRWQLYYRCTEVLLEDWDVKRKNIDRNQLLPLGFSMVADQKAELLQRVSMYMLEHRRAGSELNAIGREPLLKLLAVYLQDEYGKSPGEARAIAAEILNHLRERTYIIAEIGEQLFGFVHRTFMEFFAAEYCKAEFNRREADYEWLTRELFGTRWRQEEWREVLLLLAAMLKDQGSPVRKIIDHIREQPAQGPLPVQLGFAARCLAEATTTDDAWSRALVGQLVTAICAIAQQTSNAATRAFLDDALGSFAVLALTVSLSESTRNSIDALGQTQDLHGRMVSFQLQLSLRSKEDRLAFAVEALAKSEEAVRRGAIAALEREWPGAPEVFTALLSVLRSDRLSRVRSAALGALDRNWPSDSEILDVLESRAAIETAYTFIIEVMRYLARRWSGDRRALGILLEFSETRNVSLGSGVKAEVRTAAVEAIVEGWRHAPDCVPLLEEWAQGTGHHGALIALLGLALGWPEDSETTAWIQAFIGGQTGPRRRIEWPLELLKARPADTDLHRWVLQRAATDPDSSVRIDLISALSFAGAHREADIGLKAMNVSAAEESGSDRNNFLKFRACHDISGRVRAKALHRLVEPELNRRSQTLIVQQAAIDSYLAEQREAANLSSRYSESSTEAFIRDRLCEDQDPLVRMRSLWCLVSSKMNRSPGGQYWHRMRYLSDPEGLLRNISRSYSRSERHGPPYALFRRADRFMLSSAMGPLYDLDLDMERDFDFLVKAAENDTDPMVRAYAITLMHTLVSPGKRNSILKKSCSKESDPDVARVISALIRRKKSLSAIKDPRAALAGRPRTRLS